MKKFSYLLILLPFIQSCSEILDEKEPLDSRNEVVFYKTEQDAFEALIAVYDAAQPTSAHQVTADILSDDGYAGGASRNDIPEQIQLDQHKILTTNYICEELWRFNYTGVYRANLLLEKLPGIENYPNAELKRIEGEGHFLRAYFYWNLVRFFENIPLITKTLNPDEYAQPQADPSDVYALIYSDLLKAVELLPSELYYDGRVSKWAAQGLLARVYLFHNGVYNEELEVDGKMINAQYVRDQLDDIIANSGHELVGKPSDLFTRLSEMNRESLFEISYSDLGKWGDWTNPYGGEGSFPVVWQGPRVLEPAIEDYFRGWSFNTVTLELFESFEDNDLRKDYYILVETELNGSITKGFTHTGYFTNKYTTKQEYQATDGSPELNYGNNFVLIRFADVLLMSAELHLKTGGNKAQEYLDLIRDRAEMPSIPATIDNIFLERRRELCMEGLRYHDLMRRGLDVLEDAVNVSAKLGPLYDFKESEEIDFDITFNPATKGFLPIPQREIDMLEGAIQQNPGY